MKGLFVIGTDTGVGKTLVTAGLARLLARRGVHVGVFKPASSGGQKSADGRFLRRGAGLGREWEPWVAPVTYRRPLAPWVAGWTEGGLDLGLVERARQHLEKSFDFLLVEGVGGLHVPLTEKVWVADLAQKWNYPVLLVARVGLGTINHSLLTLEALRRRKVPVVGVLLNGAKGKSQAEATNLRALRKLAGVAVYGPLRWEPTSRSKLDLWADRLARLDIPRKFLP